MVLINEPRCDSLRKICDGKIVDRHLRTSFSRGAWKHALAGEDIGGCPFRPQRASEADIVAAIAGFPYIAIRKQRSPAEQFDLLGRRSSLAAE
jgi:hypothetical protein